MYYLCYSILFIVWLIKLNDAYNYHVMLIYLPELMSGYLKVEDLGQIAAGLNIEGDHPRYYLPPYCKWYNLIMAIDAPLKGDNFDDVMDRVNKNKYDLIEKAVDIDVEQFIDQLVDIINKMKKDHNNLLVHVHQYDGTTVLHKILENKTGVKCITDITNYNEYPTNYRVDYPQIDGLFSISQCAGLGADAGAWIIPDKFMYYYVNDEYITTQPHVDYSYVDFSYSDIKKYIDFEYIEGTILIVDGLWNPDVNNHAGVLLFDLDDMTVFDFVVKMTEKSEFDESHDWHHAVKVARNSTRILNTKHVLYLALLHDVCDHKYPNAIPREELSKFIKNMLPNEYECIDSMIDIISFSKQKKNPVLGINVDPIVAAVRDGDRLEAIGQIGIERCIQFTNHIGGKVPDDVIKHCYDKLLRLVPENYISTEIGREHAIKEHNMIIDYVKENLPKTDLQFDIPEYL
jgi:HD superfamily phosphodiesterase